MHGDPVCLHAPTASQVHDRAQRFSSVVELDARNAFVLAHVQNQRERREGFVPATDAPKEDLFRLHAFLGVERGVFVQSTCHGSDHAALLDLLAAGAGRYRGVALLDPDAAGTPGSIVWTTLACAASGCIFIFRILVRRCGATTCSR